jgi:hypothetical protein
MMAGNFGACICLKGKAEEVGDTEALGSRISQFYLLLILRLCLSCALISI